MRLAARIVGVVSILLYGIALAVPAVGLKWYATINTPSGKEKILSDSIDFHTGWFCLVDGYFVLPYWLANPCLFGAWFALFRGSRLSAYWASGAVMFSVMFTVNSINDPPTTFFREGYWLWMISIGLATIAGFMLVFAKPVPQTPR